MPIKDLVRPGRFLLIAGEEGEAWCEAARSLAEAHSLPLDAVRIGHLDGDWYDPRCTWLRHRVIGPTARCSCDPTGSWPGATRASRRTPQASSPAPSTQILARPIEMPTVRRKLTQRTIGDQHMTDAAVIQPKFHHVNLKTTRLQEMIDWYRTAASAPRCSSRPTTGRGCPTTRPTTGSRCCAFPGFVDDPEKDTRTGMHHSAFEYDSFEELNASYLRLRDAGITPDICLDHGMTFSYYYKDPDGNYVELQCDIFGDWAKSSEWMRDERGVPLKPDGHVRRPGARRRRPPAEGATLAEIHERAKAKEFSPGEAPVDIPYAELTDAPAHIRRRQRPAGRHPGRRGRRTGRRRSTHRRAL